jgi:hypothetical protein
MVATAGLVRVIHYATTVSRRLMMMSPSWRAASGSVRGFNLSGTDHSVRSGPPERVRLVAGGRTDSRAVAIRREHRALRARHLIWNETRMDWARHAPILGRPRAGCAADVTRVIR